MSCCTYSDSPFCFAVIVPVNLVPRACDSPVLWGETRDRGIAGSGNEIAFQLSTLLSSTGPGLGLIMYILSTLVFPTHNLNFYLLTTSVNAKYYYKGKDPVERWSRVSQNMEIEIVAREGRYI